MMEAIALTKSSPDAGGAGRTRSRGCGYLNRNAPGLASRNRATPLVHLLVGSRLARNRDILAGIAGERLQLRHERCCGEIITHCGYRCAFQLRHMPTQPCRMIGNAGVDAAAYVLGMARLQ